MRSLLFLLGLFFLLPAFAEEAASPPPPSHHVHIPRVFLPQEPESGESQVSFPLVCTPSLTAQVSLSSSIGSGGSCPQTWFQQDVQVQGPDAQVWLSIQRQIIRSEDSEDSPLPALELECRADRLRVRCGRAPALVLKLWPDGHASVDPSLERQLKQRLSAPVSGGKLLEARHIEYLVSLVPDDEAYPRLWSLARAYRLSVQMAMGQKAPPWEMPDPEMLKDLPEVAARFRKLKQKADREEEARRRKTEEQLHRDRPLHLEALRSLGALPREPSLAPMQDAELFWRGGELCVSQMDGSQKMRCIDIGTNHWGPIEPMPPYGPEHSLGKSTGGCHPLVCSRGGACVVGGSTAVGVTADEQHLILAQGTWSTEEPDKRTLSPEEVSAAVAQGPGGRVLGGGHYVMVNAEHFRRAKGPWRAWALFAAPPQQPQGGRWLGTVVSPDQRHLAAVSGTSSSYVLWVASIVPGPGAPNHP